MIPRIRGRQWNVVLLLALCLMAFLTPAGPAQASTYENVTFRGWKRPNGLTTILITPCGTGSKLQLRSELLGSWTSDLFNRNGTANCAVPNPPNDWQILVNASVGQRARIYSLMGESYLPEAEFMVRARRDDCTIVAYGDISCTPVANSQPRMLIEAPAANQSIDGEVTLSGWAVDLAARTGPGVDQVEAYVSDGGPEIALGPVQYGLTRGDVAGTFADSRFTNSGYSLTFDPSALGLRAGPATLRVRMHSSEAGGGWTESTRAFTIGANTPPGSCAVSQYQEQHYFGTNLSGPIFFSGCTDAIDYSWLAGVDDISIRWTRTISVEAGAYTFFSYFDDGYRVWVDSTPVIDRWIDQPPSQQTPVSMSAGEHLLKIEYYLNYDGGNGSAHFRFMRTPVLTSISPDSVVENAGDVPVVISGQFFQEPLTAAIDGVPLTAITLLDPNTITAVVPVGQLAIGSHTLSVSSAGYQLTLPGAFQVEPRREPTTFRAMFVLACDSQDIAPACSEVFNKLEQAMANHPDLRIVVLWDGPKNGDSAFFRIKADTDPNNPATYQEGIDYFPQQEIDTGDRATVIKFAGWAQGQYPGTYKLLDLYGHGGGWAPQLYADQQRGYHDKPTIDGIGGMLWDDSSRTTLTTRDLARALQSITAAYHLDVLYLDACLMSTTEVLAEVSPYADYVIANENKTWAIPDGYDQALGAVSSTTSPYQLAQNIVDVLWQSWQGSGLPNQISVVQSAAMPRVLQQIDLLASALIDALPTQRDAIQAAAEHTIHLDDSNNYHLDSDDTTLDARNFAEQLIANPAISPVVKGYAHELIIALDAATPLNKHVNGTVPPYKTNNPIFWNHDHLGGQSLYFPLQDEWRRPYYGALSLPTFAGTHWDEFIQAWHYGQVAPAPPAFCAECRTTPTHLVLSLDPPAFAPMDRTLMVPVYLSGALQGDDLRGLQIAVTVSDTKVLVPDRAHMPEPGDLFARGSYTSAASTQNSWNFMVDVPPPPADPIEGSGLVVSLPFVPISQGCVDLVFTVHKLRTSRIATITHATFNGSVCLRERGDISGNIYLEARHPGQYDSVEVVLQGASGTKTTRTDMNGHFTFDQVIAGSYTLVAKQSLYMQAERPVRLSDVESLRLSDIGLWAGDMNANKRVSGADWRVCAAAAMPVNDPSFDLDLDHVTDVGDCTIVRNNLGRQDMETTNPPRDFYDWVLPRTLADMASSATLHTPTAEASYLSGNRHVSLRSLSTTADGLSLSLGELGGAAAFGLRFDLPANATVEDVAWDELPQGTFAQWHQEDRALYIIMATTDNQVFGDAPLTLRLRGIDQAAIAASTVVPADTYRCYLPLISQ